jgi:nucleoside-diphosphate-sugar epimerase
MRALDVFLTGGTGYMGARLGAALAVRGHRVRGLTRAGSAGRLPARVGPVIGDALNGATYAAAVAPADTFVHLVGTPHPNPSKAAEFERVDLASARAAVDAAKAAGVRHFVYVSVAQPAPVMRAYVAVRAAAEAHLRASGLNATILRPWYVLGPGHRWPYALVPFYWLAERFPPTRDNAHRLGLVTIDQMVGALVRAVENPIIGFRVVEVPGIRGRLP